MFRSDESFWLAIWAMVFIFMMTVITFLHSESDNRDALVAKASNPVIMRCALDETFSRELCNRAIGQTKE